MFWRENSNVVKFTNESLTFEKNLPFFPCLWKKYRHRQDIFAYFPNVAVSQSSSSTTSGSASGTSGASEGLKAKGREIKKLNQHTDKNYGTYY